MKKITQKILKYTVIFEPAEEGGYVVSVPALPGCFTEGDTLEEAMEMIKDAISAYVASLGKHHEPIPQESGPSLVSVVDVPVPATF
ncbi:MAG: type II toxin-antitoxin system HicB family antitoxin [Candidatus Daviesbacteria bacterium]|nr:type II toxin-antitoxin system HicB family antitoxin [Candidatus Daviesbacteria bacterium]